MCRLNIRVSATDMCVSVNWATSVSVLSNNVIFPLQYVVCILLELNKVLRSLFFAKCYKFITF